MTVSWRHIAVGAVSCVALAGGWSAMGQQCCTAPNIPRPQPPTYGGCCDAPSSLIVTVPGVSVASPNVSVGASSSSVAVAGVSTTLSSGVVVSGSGSASGAGYAYGGGSSYGGGGVIGGGSGGTIRGLNVDGGYETKTVDEEVSVSEQYCIDKVSEVRVIRPVQAMCVDDRDTPHPASRVDDERQVGPGYRGEVYRCMAGTHMQVTTGEMVNGQPSFAAGETFSCKKGESVWHGAGGKLTCKTQTPERNCNERSLLRRFGPGVKLVEVSSPKTVCEPATRMVKQSVKKEVKVPRSLAVGDLQLDGGVGN